MTLRVGFTGGGNISDTHVRAVADVPGLQAVGVCGPNATKVEALAARYGLATASSLAALLDQHGPLDIVCLGSPSGVHADEIALAASRGCHILTEKPLDVTLERDPGARLKACVVHLGRTLDDRSVLDLVRWLGMVREMSPGRAGGARSYGSERTNQPERQSPSASTSTGAKPA